MKGTVEKRLNFKRQCYHHRHWIFFLPAAKKKRNGKIIRTQKKWSKDFVNTWIVKCSKKLQQQYEFLSKKKGEFSLIDVVECWLNEMERAIQNELPLWYLIWSDKNLLGNSVSREMFLWMENLKFISPLCRLFRLIFSLFCLRLAKTTFLLDSKVDAILWVL